MMGQISAAALRRLRSSGAVMSLMAGRLLATMTTCMTAAEHMMYV
jgi:hypothetical protein